jgi:hypothetical protein
VTAPHSHVGEDTITVLRAPLAVDRFNAEYRDWPRATATELVGVAMQPLANLEQPAGREFVTTRYRLVAPSTADLLATDRVLWRGVTFELAGPPEVWADMRNVAHHIEAALVRMVG